MRFRSLAYLQPKLSPVPLSTRGFCNYFTPAIGFSVVGHFADPEASFPASRQQNTHLSSGAGVHRTPLLCLYNPSGWVIMCVSSGGDMDCNEQQAASSANQRTHLTESEILEILELVSYTHLDVYKRQLMMWHWITLATYTSRIH